MKTGIALEQMPLPMNNAASELDLPAGTRTSGISRPPRGTRTRISPTKPPARPRSNPEDCSPALRERNVTAQDLQGAVLFVLGLFASLAVLNLHAEMAHLLQHWHRFVEFLASSVF
ncbi:MAG: hypothetical protein AB9869_08335 [Verrucomicrobiia bacterium]